MANSSQHSARICLLISWSLAIILPFLVFFDSNRNTDMQGLILLVSGGFAWVAIAQQPNKYLKALPKFYASLAIFIACSIASLALNPHYGYDLLGSPHIRLGVLGLIACIGCGLTLSQVPVKNLLIYLYGCLDLAAILSIPYNLIKFHSLIRSGGIFAQADVFACFLGICLLIGFGLWRHFPEYKRPIVVNQLLLGVLMLLTETRAIIILIIFIGLLLSFLNQNRNVFYKNLIVISAVVIASTFALHSLFPDRLTNTNYASESVTYRLNLQTAGLRASFKKPWLGYGIGNLADALNCPSLHYSDLQKTCQRNYFFNSSHNIFLDRVLGFGWIGGLAFAGFTVINIWRGLKSSNPDINIIACAGLLIALYYFTNVTSVTLELLFWILVLRLSGPSRALA